MPLLNYCKKSYRCINLLSRRLSISYARQQKNEEFETVFSFPTIKYISIINRLKVYHLAASSVAIPSCGALEMANVFPDASFLMASYIGVTATAVLCLGTLPFRNIIGFLYISEDNQRIKISSVDFWGKRIDKIIPTNDWIPLMDMSPNPMDAIYLSPRLSDGTKYKLFLRFGKIYNSRKMGQVLE